MNTLLEAFEILKEIGECTKRTDKENLLKKGEPNEFLKTLLQYTYDPFKIYFIKKVPKITPQDVKEDNEAMVDRFKYLLSALQQLEDRQVTGNSAIELVTDLLNSCTADEVHWYTKVIQKDMKIGITEKTLNKVYGKGFVPVYNCILADKMTKLSDLPERFYIEPKLDGMRIQASVNNDKSVILKSRNGKVVYGYDELERELGKYLPSGYVYDGEIMSKELNSNASEGVKTCAGFNSLMTQAFAKTSGKEGILNIFDCIPVQEFETETSTQTQLDRKLLLLDMYNKIPDKTEVNSFTIVPHMGIFERDNEDDISAMYKMYNLFVKLGYEGGMVKDITMPYIYKRTKRLLKLKPMDDFDLEVIDLEEGAGKYSGVLGAAVVDLNGYRVNVGSGFTDHERVMFWQDKQLLLGKTIQVQAQEITTNKSGTQSLRFPTFKGIRLDK